MAALWVSVIDNFKAASSYIPLPPGSSFVAVDEVNCE